MGFNVYRTISQMYRHNTMWKFLRRHNAVHKHTFSPSNRSCTSLNVNIGDDIAVKPFKAIPGPDPSRFNLLYYWRDFRKFISQPDEFYQMRHEQYPSGMFREKMGSQETVHITDPATIQEFYRQEDKYPSRMQMQGFVEHMTERKRQLGIVSLEGAEWHRTRKALDHILLRPRPMLEYASTLNEVAVEFVTRLETLQQQQGPDKPIPNMVHELWMWALESVTAILFESRFEVLKENQSPRLKKLVQSVQYTVANFSLIATLPSRTAKLIAPRRYKKLLAALDTTHNISVEILGEQLKEISAKLERGEQPGGFLSYLVAKQQLSESEISTNVQDLMAAGGDTTATTMQWLLYLLSKNPVVQEKIFAEVSKLQLDVKDFDKNCINEMHYVKAAIKESMRIHPIIAAVGRKIKREIKIQGYHIPPNTCVIMSPVMMNKTNMPEFRPERWLKQNKQSMNPFSSIPFGFGVRMCIGRRVAELEIQLLISNLVRKFHILPGDPTPLISKPGIIRGPTKPVSIILKTRHAK